MEHLSELGLYRQATYAHAFKYSYSGPSVEEDDAEKQVLRSYMPAESAVWLPATGCLEREVNDLLCLSGEW
jgi:hypothetical protein